MYQGFWNKLEKPIIGLSPMDGVTDAPMRYITAKYGKPDVMVTEFVSVEGIIHGAKRLMRDFKYDEIERPVVAQIFGGDPESFFQVAKLIVKMGFDGVDINMGCPAKKVAGRGEGAGLIKNPPLAAEIIAATKKGVAGKIPVSVKTRIGYNEPEPEWWRFLATQDLAAVTIHGRTFKQLYEGKANWEAIGEAAKIIKSEKTIFLGNGDVEDIARGSFLSDHFGTDGVLIGRGAWGNPKIFDTAHSSFTIEEEKREKLAIMLEHARKFEEIFPEDTLPAGRQGFFIMRKHLSWYAKGFDNASELRSKLVMTNCAAEVEEVLKSCS